MYKGKYAILWQASFASTLEQSGKDVVSRRSSAVSHFLRGSAGCLDG
jgi:hypothetical protein